MRLDIRYVTRFDYDGVVVESQNELRACPSTDEHQYLVHYQVTTAPPSRVASYADYWGTRVDTFGVRAPHDHLEVVASATVETVERALPTLDVPLAALADADWRDEHLEFLQRSAHVAWGDTVVAFAREAAAGATDVLGVVRAVDAAVGSLEYRRGRTTVGVPVDRVLAEGAGVCQDFAHLAIAAYRILGVPARYVSGFFFSADDATGAEARDDVVEVETHAWVEVAVPGVGWVALDPTNRQAVGPRHVAIGRGRDYDDVAPFRGVFSGAVGHELSVSVTMRRLALEPLARASSVDPFADDPGSVRPPGGAAVSGGQ
jgi:transglutaminase-like putative cysteine protease